MFKITVFRQKSNGLEHMVLTKGEWTEDEPVLLRVHSSCATGDILDRAAATAARSSTKRCA